MNLQDQQNQHLRELVSVIYPELRRIARSLLRKESSCFSIQPTHLANETIARILARHVDLSDHPRALIAYSLREMRNILIDAGRSRRRRLSPITSPPQVDDLGVGGLIDISRCLERLHEIDPRAREVVELRYFLGLTVNETAEYLNLSVRTVNEDWEFARAWLATQLTAQTRPSVPSA